MKKVFDEIPYIEGEHIILKKVEKEDADRLDQMRKNKKVNKYLPTFLFEKKYDDINEVIDKLYTECFNESIIMGIYDKADMRFCGLGEFYGYKDNIHKISVGARFLEEECGKGFGTETARLMVDYLCNETDIEIITASIMKDNIASRRAIEKAGFTLVTDSSKEDFGFDEPVDVTKWIY